MDIFERIWDSIYLVVLGLMTPLVIYVFIGVSSAGQELSKLPTRDEIIASSIKKYKRQAAELEKKAQPVKKKEFIPPPQLYRPGNDDFNIPLEQLLEGNHGRLL